MADRTPVWSPDGAQVAWFADAGSGYRLLIGDQDGLGTPREISIGDAKYAFVAAWSPDGSRIAFVDDKARLRVLEIATGRIVTADTDGSVWNRAGLQPAWSPDSKWLAYSKVYPNQFRRILVWSVADGRSRQLTDGLADAIRPVWDRNGRWLYFLASTDLGLASGFANISSINRPVTRGVYLAVLRANDSTPFAPESDEERVAPAPTAAPPAATPPAPSKDSAGGKTSTEVRIDFERLDRRILALQMPVRDYADLAVGGTGALFVAERVANQPGMTLHRYDVSKRRADVFLPTVQRFSTSGDGKRILVQAAGAWRNVGTEAPPRPDDGRINLALRVQVDPQVEWQQIFDEAWRIERDFFYATNTHGADWNAVRARHAPLVAHVRHRDDLNYLLDQLGGELSVGHSFVFGATSRRSTPRGLVCSALTSGSRAIAGGLHGS